MISELDLYILNSDNSVAPFPSEAEQIVLYDFAFEAQRMGAAPEITATIQANGYLENYLTTKVFCKYNGERYFLKSLPSSSKENTDPRYTFDLTFVSERTILDNVYMIDAVQGDSSIDHYQSNSTKIVFMGTISEYVGRLNAAMTYAGVGYSVVIDGGISSDSYLVSFENKVFTEALQEIPNIYKLPYYYAGKQIHVGWAERDIEQVVKYADGLLNISKDIANTTIITRATGVGSSENIPYYYPNPTPLGTIEAVSDANVTLVDPYKFSKIPSGNKLRYYQKAASVEMMHYANATIDDNAAIIATPYQEEITLPHETEVLSGALVRCSTIDGYSRPVKVFFDFSIISGETPIQDIQRISYAVYKYSELDDKIVLTEDLSVKVSKDVSAEGEFCFIENFPSDTDRYVMAVYSNMSGWDAVLKPRVTVSLDSDADNAGWWFVSPTGVRGEKVSDLSKYGLSASGEIKGGSEVFLSVVNVVPYAQNLMPPIYKNSGGAERFYNALNNTYKLNGTLVEFENEFDVSAPKEGVVTLDDIKPTIKGITNNAGLPIDMFSAFAYDLYDDDSTTSKGDSEEYNHPYFYGKLRRFDGDYGFNLFEQALETGEMTIEMTSGVCGACKFTIMVDSNTQRNLVMVDDNGDLIFDPAAGNVLMSEDPQGLPSQNDTRSNEVWVALKKDISTFGQIMPNVTYNHYPKAGDTFVITNINLPEAYIAKAEKELEDGIIRFLLDSNRYRYDFDVNFSRIFLKQNKLFASQLNENATLGVEYNGNIYRFYITSFTYRKSKGELLPEISVALSEDIATETGSFSRSISDVKMEMERYVSSKAHIDELSKTFIRKDIAERVTKPITFDDSVILGKGIKSKGFKSGYANGVGLGLYKDVDGNFVIETDKVIVRQKVEGGSTNSPSAPINAVTVNKDQTITGIKDFVNGLKVNGALLRYNPETRSFEFPANLDFISAKARGPMTVDGLLTVGNGIKSEDYVEGDIGKGFAIEKDADGNTVITTDKLKVRMAAEFEEVVINQISFQLGSTVISLAGCEITSVEEVGDTYRCYYDNKNGQRFSGFEVGDQARCQRYDSQYDSIVKYYWRVVKAVGEDYVDLYIGGVDGNGLPLADGAGVPAAGDHIVHFGSRRNTARQNAIVISSTPSPAIIQYIGISSFTLPSPSTVISPDGNKFSGAVHIGEGSTGIENLKGLPDAVQDVVNKMDLDIDTDSLEFGKYNLLRNSGFTGDYLSAQLQGGKGLNDNSQMFSPSLEHWTVSDCVAQASNNSESGFEVAMANGAMLQTLKNKILVGENYVLSFKAKGTSLTFSVGGVSKTIALTDEYTRYVEKFTATTTTNVFSISANATICEVQLERGTVVSAWGHSMWDNQSELAYYQSLQYLASAMKDGSTTILGGLILSQLIALGNYKNGEMTKVTSGINGLYNDDDDVAFWAGGDLEKAILTVQKHRENPLYQPTEEEWSNMAKFVATHGGDVFMKGYIYALGGLFKGAVSIANGKILLNADGSGAMANGAFSWDTFGRITRYYPERENWIDLRDATTMSHDDGGFFISPLRDIGEDVEPISDDGNNVLVIPTPTLSPYVFCIKGRDGGAPEGYASKPFTTDSQKVLFRVYGKTETFVAHNLNMTALPNQGTITVEYDSTPDDYNNTYYNITLPLTMDASYTSFTDTIEIL